MEFKGMVSTQNINEHITTESSLLQELRKQKDKLDECSKNFMEALENISSGAENLKCNISTENTLKIGIESVKPLRDIKTVATEVFSDVRNNDIEILHKPINLEAYENHIADMRRENQETRKMINLLNVLADATAKLIEPQNQLANGSSIESNASTQSIASSDPSISEFSVFDNSMIGAASSPIAASETNKKL